MSYRMECFSRWYAAYARWLSYGQDALLLVVRLYWGWGFFVAGKGKLLNLNATAEAFRDWGIPAPWLNALIAASIECLGGMLLLVGLGSRLVAVLLIGVMTVAYLTAHRAEAMSVFSDPGAFVMAPPFAFLFASLLVLLFGSGWFSVDALVGNYYERRRRAAVAVLPEGAGAAPTRRDFGKLLAAAVAGLATGLLLAQLRRKESQLAPGPAKPADQAARQPAVDSKTPKEEKPQPSAANHDEDLLLATEHVCRGLNTCRGKGKDGKNACTGQGTCALVQTHACNGLNDCKGHGGCDGHPGQNQCKGQGACAVPMREETWKKARAKFEELLARQGKHAGPAPAKS